MFITVVYNGFKKKIRDLFQDFYFLTDEDIYDPDLDFNLDTRKYIVPNFDVKIISKALPNKAWIQPIYNREKLEKPDYLPSQNFKLLDKDLINFKTNIHNLSFAKCSYHYVLISNSFSVLERFEELFKSRFKEDDQINCIFPFKASDTDIGGEYDVNIDNIYIDKSQKMPRADFGSLAMLGLTFQCHFPIYELNQIDVPLIQSLEFNIYNQETDKKIE